MRPIDEQVRMAFYADVSADNDGPDDVLNLATERRYTQPLIDAVRTSRGYIDTDVLNAAEESDVQDELVWLYCIGRAALLDPAQIGVVINSPIESAKLVAVVWQFPANVSTIGTCVMVYTDKNKTYSLGLLADKDYMLANLDGERYT